MHAPRPDHVAWIVCAIASITACTFPDVDIGDTPGGGGASVETTLATGSTVTSAGGGPSTSSSNAGGGDAPTSSSTGGGEGGSTSATLTGAGGGVVGIACADGCIPFPEGGAGGAGGGGAGGDGAGGSVGGGGANDDCDHDGDPDISDCQPCDPLVFHGQETYFDEAFATFEDPDDSSFDYDCSGAEDVEYPYEPDGCSGVATAVCGDTPIFTGDDAPACGESRFVQDCMEVGVVLTTCDLDGAGTNMDVRCR